MSETYTLDTRPVFVCPPDGETLTITNGGPADLVYAEGEQFTLAGVKGSIDVQDSQEFTRPVWIVSDALGANVNVRSDAEDEPPKVL